jgi:Zn-dependent metalloprotease
MSTQLNNAAVVDTCTKRLTALKEHVGNSKGTIPMNGEDLKVNDVIAIYQGCLDSRTALAKARTQVKAALATKTSAEQARVEADKALSAWVTTKFGAGSETALDFGFSPRKAPTQTVESKANAIAQNKATRAARNTMGKKKKADANPRAPVDDFVELRVVA